VPPRPSERPAAPPLGDDWFLPAITVPPHTRLFRLNLRKFGDPAYFGRRAVYRFDAPDGSFGVCYLGTTLDCCVLEVLRPARDPGARQRLLSRRQLREYFVAIATVREPLLLAYLADDGLAQAGIDQRVTAGDDYALSQAWAAAIHAHRGTVDGIFYATRHHNALYAVALFERARGKVALERWGVLGDRRTRDLWHETARILERFRIALLE
jgi:hypothetical protein